MKYNFVPEGSLILESSVDPDEVQHFAVFHLGIHYFLAS